MKCSIVVIKADLGFMIVMPSELNLGANKSTAPVSDEEVGVNFIPKSSQGQTYFSAVPNYSVGFQGWLDSVLRSQFCRD